MSEKDAQAIYNWVKKGGVLLLFHNDKGNCDFDSIKKLTHNFGFEFNELSENKVEGKKFEQGKVISKDNVTIFRTAKTLFLKEVSTVKLTPTSTCAIYPDIEVQLMVKPTSDGIVAIRCVFDPNGGKIFAVGDPWLYNEYVDGRKLPVEYENFKAANDLVKWALSQSQKSKVKNKK
jgi:unsaturated rhamnogalacturonyl hydrolase